MTVQTLTLENVKAAARKAYDEGRLIAQSQQVPTVYAYVWNGSCCAIGAALDDDTIKVMREERLNEDTGFNTLVECSLVDTDDVNDVELIIAVQTAHDHWADAVRYEQSPKDWPFRHPRPKPREALALFLRLIDHPSAAA